MCWYIICIEQFVLYNSDFSCTVHTCTCLLCIFHPLTTLIFSRLALHLYTCTLSVTAFYSFAKSDERLPAKMEETDEAEGMRAEREAGGSDELQSRIQELEGHLEESESKRLDLDHDNMALRNKLKVVHEQKAYLEEDAARLRKKLLSVECSQVKLEVWIVWCIRTKCACLISGGAVSHTPNVSIHSTPPICCTT